MIRQLSILYTGNKFAASKELDSADKAAAAKTLLKQLEEGGYDKCLAGKATVLVKCQKKTVRVRIKVKAA